MEALAAISLAGNIIQFVEIGIKVIKECKEIHDSRSAIIRENLVIEAATTELERITVSLLPSDPARDLALVSREEHDLHELAIKCQSTAKRLQVILKELSDVGPRKRDALVAFIRSRRYKDEVDFISKELYEYRQLLDTAILLDLRKRADLTALQHEKNFKSLDENLQRIVHALQDQDASPRTVYNALASIQEQSSVDFARIHDALVDGRSKSFDEFNQLVNGLTVGRTETSQKIDQLRDDVNRLFESTESSRQSKKLLQTIPFERDPTFVGRTAILEQIEQMFSNTGRACLAGIGGIGKSQIAIETCYRYRDAHPNHHILWVHCGNRARFTQAYNDIARQLELPGVSDPTVDVLKLVAEWLDSQSNIGWLMILDNADDYGLFLPPKSSTPSPSLAAILPYLPKSQAGRVLITTRDKRVGSFLAGDKRTVQIDSPTMDEAMQLLSSRLPNEDGLNAGSDLQDLVSALDMLPLAITQAAAFISINDMSIAEYLELFAEDIDNVEDLLDQDLGDERRDLDSGNSVVKTWKLSFDTIRAQKPLAADLLSFMAMLDRQSIPVSLMKRLSDRPVELKTALTTLRSFGLVTSSANGTLFAMHRLVNVCVCKWLKTEDAAARWEEEATEALLKEFPFNMLDLLSQSEKDSCAILAPHAINVLHYDGQSERSKLNKSNLLYRLSKYDIEQGNFKAALERASAALQISTEIFGADHRDTLRITGTIGDVHNALGDLKESESLHIKVLHARQQHLGPDDTDTLSSMGAVARAYYELGRRDEAEALLISGISLASQRFEDDHVLLLHGRGMLAEIYRVQGRLDEAEALQSKVLQIRKRKYGDNDPRTMQNVAMLGNVYVVQRRFDEAQKHILMNLEYQKRINGPDHIGVLIGMLNLASTYHEQGRLDEAEKLQLYGLEQMERVLGDKHPRTLSSINNLVITYYRKGEFAKAEKLALDVIERSKLTLGETHPDTINRVQSLANIYHNENELLKAEKLLVEVLARSRRALGDDHLLTLTRMENLARTYYAQDKLLESEKLDSELFERSKIVLGLTHRNTLERMASLSSTYRRQERYTEAESLSKSALETSREALGETDMDTLARMAGLSALYYLQSKLEQAEELAVAVLEHTRSVLGNDHATTLIRMEDLATIYDSQERHDEAAALRAEIADFESKKA